MAFRALIIDDDAMNLEVLGRLLSKEGVDFVAVQDSTQIMSTLDSVSGFDAVFLDLEMPRINGYEAIALIQERLGTDIPIVACTVHVNEVENSRRLGFHSFISKPLDAAMFPHQLANIMNGEPVWAI